jgi:serine/threonine-protein kinase
MGDLLHQRFRLLKPLGTGGTGQVHKAEDTRLKRLVAIKRAHGENALERRKKVARLLREAEHLAQVDHPNVVRIHDVIETDIAVTLVMEFVEGRHLKSLYRKQSLPEHELLDYFEQLLSAIEAVHEAGLLHRDVNPSNILITPAGTLKLLDFGLSCKAGAPEQRAGGTIGYMAPESLRKGTLVNQAVDLYGLGLIAYRALLGGPEFKRLYGTKDAMEWARWLLSKERFKPLIELGLPVSPAFSAIVERLVEKDVKERYARAREVRADLERLTGGHQAPPATAPAEGPSLASGMRRLLPGLLLRGERKAAGGAEE